MLIKEYRIPLPLTVEEYRIAQLYMIAKKSRDESKGAGSGVEFLTNEPYEDGPGPTGTGQYTTKIYHVGSHLPGWFKSLLPKAALTVEEEAWNAYPYTKTRYTCPFVQRFSLEIETLYCDDAGHQENVFGLSGSDLRNRFVDLIDVVKDQLHGTDYVREEDPKLYVSQKTGRGPLYDNWIEDYWNECKGKPMPSPTGKAIMCAYKLCRVEFHYWGMQSKIEKFIHDVALRRIMLRAHRQAWAWQDEWHGMTISDIRVLESQIQEALRKRMAGDYDGDDLEDYDSSCDAVVSKDPPYDCPSSNSSSRKSDQGNQQNWGSAEPYDSKPSSTAPVIVTFSDLSDPKRAGGSGGGGGGGGVESCAKSKSLGAKGTANISSPGSKSNKSFGAAWKVEGLMKKETDSEGSEDEFYDCLDGDDAVSLTKWSSMDLIPQNEDAQLDHKRDDSIFSQPFLQRATTERDRRKVLVSRGSIEASVPGSPTIFGGANTVLPSTCSTTVLCMVLHAGSALDATVDLPAKKSDVTTFKGAFESVIRQHYPSMMGHVVVKLVPCPSVCTDALAILSSLSPYSFDVYGTGDSPQMTHESVPIGAIPLISTSQLEYLDAACKTVVAANQVYTEFLKSEEGHGFSGQIVFIGDSMGSILGYDALTKHSCSGQFGNEDEVPPSPDHLHCPTSESARRRSSSSASDSGNAKLDFEVSDFFMFGSPLGLVLAQRKIQSDDKHMPWSRPCQQVYNLFHPTDPLAARLEPLISARFAGVPPVNVARYTKYPLGDGLPFHLLESIQANPHLFAESSSGFGALASSCGRRLSDISIQSGMSGLTDALSLQAINQLTQKWWGNKRIDYALYCPEALASFPLHSLPHLFHASYWESTDAIAFILRQIGFQENSLLSQDEKEVRVFTPNQPREKWIKKRTSVKLKNVAANHRANDVIVREGNVQVLKARFMYGPVDMVTLSGEKVDIYIMKDPPMGEWSQLSTEVTDKNGRICYTIPPDKALGYGIYPVKMVVRGDHTCVDFYCAVVPPKTECVVFSIDGSFTASVSVTGKDPRVRAGAVDVVRHWQELGYLIIYVTGRPDMQQHKVVSWLAQHNFPHGLVSFADGLSTDFLGHKADYLRSLVQDQKLLIHAAYGSSKDIGVYACATVSADRIFIVGKASKKQHALATVLTDGYSAHLNALQAHGGSRPAQGNARMVIPRGYFGLPGQPLAMRRRSNTSFRSAKRTTSYPVMSSSADVAAVALTGRGISPRRPKASLSTFPN